MSPRLLYNTKWLCCLVAIHAGSFWGQARSVTVRSPPSNPSTIEAQAKFFQDFFSVQLSPYKIEFGHVCEDPNTWEQRYEKKDFKNHRDMGKVRWGDKKGGYGEHYWDLNHAGHTGSLDDGYDGDDGSYHESSNNDPYDEPSDHSPTYATEEYDPEKSSYEESGRAKRAHPKIKIEKRHYKQSDTHEEEAKAHKQKRKNKEELEGAATHQDEEFADNGDDEPYEKPKPKRQKHKKQEDNHHNKKQEENEQHQNHQQPKEKNQFVLVVSHKDDSGKQKSEYQPQYAPRQPELPQYLPNKQPEFAQYLQKPELPQYVPYEGGAGVRQHQPEVSAATTVPRLFLEPSTGHVVDRTTGQAYVLQPIAAPKRQLESSIV